MAAAPAAPPNKPDLANSADPTAIYAAMRPDQRTAIGLEFQRLFTLAGDTAAPRFTPQNGMLTPEQVAALHLYARQHQPRILAEVMRHPVTIASLDWLATGETPPSLAGEGEDKRGFLRSLLRR